jgi:membrane-associated protease RseP (regulator of RpoE activity)
MKKGILAVSMLVLLFGTPATYAAVCPGDASQYPGEYSEMQKAKGSYLGVEVNDIDADRVKPLNLKDESGVEVTAVDDEGPAGKAGFKEHDVILSVNGTKIESEEQLRRTIRETPSGRVVDIVISRNGQQMTLKPTLGSRTQSMYMAMPRVAPMPDIHVEPHIAPMPPQAFAFEMPDIPDVRVYTNTPRVGAMIENLTPQLRDFFGVKNGSGLLVRSVEKGSAAEAGGLKAGDVIIRVDTDRVNDASDWRRALRNKSGSVQIGIVRDKREQNVTVKLPARRETGALVNQEDFDWNGAVDMEALRKELKELPQITEEQKMAMLQAQKDWQKEFEAHRGEWQKSMKDAQKEALKSQGKAMKDLQKEMEKMQKDMQKSFHFISFDNFE